MELYISREWNGKAALQITQSTSSRRSWDLIPTLSRLAENNMENFRLNNRFVDLTLEGTLVLQRLEKFEGEKNILGLQMQYYEYLL